MRQRYVVQQTMPRTVISILLSLLLVLPAMASAAACPQAQPSPTAVAGCAGPGVSAPCPDRQTAYQPTHCQADGCTVTSVPAAAPAMALVISRVGIVRAEPLQRLTSVPLALPYRPPIG